MKLAHVTLPGSGIPSFEDRSFLILYDLILLKPRLPAAAPQHCSTRWGDACG
jgi:hypothetical protein